MLLPHDRTVADAFRPRSPGLTRLLVLVLVWVAWLIAPAADDEASSSAASNRSTAATSCPATATSTRWTAARDLAGDRRQHRDGREQSTEEDHLDQGLAASEFVETGEDWATAATPNVPADLGTRVARPPRAHDRRAEARCVHRTPARAPPTVA